MQISNIVTAYVNSLQRDLLFQVFCLCVLLPTACTCLCVLVWECVRLVVPPPLSASSQAVWSCTRARMGARLQATLLVPLRWSCTSAALRDAHLPSAHEEDRYYLPPNATAPALFRKAGSKVQRWKVTAEGEWCIICGFKLQLLR